MKYYCFSLSVYGEFVSNMGGWGWGWNKNVLGGKKNENLISGRRKGYAGHLLGTREYLFCKIPVCQGIKIF